MGQKIASLVGAVTEITAITWSPEQLVEGGSFSFSISVKNTSFERQTIRVTFVQGFDVWQYLGPGDINPGATRAFVDTYALVQPYNPNVIYCIVEYYDFAAGWVVDSTTGEIAIAVGQEPPPPVGSWVPVASFLLPVGLSVNQAWVQVAARTLSVPVALSQLWVQVAARNLSVPVSISQQWVQVAARTLAVPISVTNQWVQVAARVLTVAVIPIEPPPPPPPGGGANLPLILGGAALAAALLANQKPVPPTKVSRKA